MKPLVPVLALVSLSPAVVAAQDLRRPVSLAAGIGIELLGIRDNTDWNLGRTLHLSVQGQPPRSPWGVRASAWLFDRHQIGRAQAAGFGLDITHQFARHATRPYLAVGLGTSWLYYSGSGPPGASNAPLRDSWSGYYLLGLGIDRSLGPVGILAEARYLRFTRGDGFATHIIPVTLGIRF